jgi:hypothetical protein
MCLSLHPFIDSDDHFFALVATMKQQLEWLNRFHADARAKSMEITISKTKQRRENKRTGHNTTLGG